MPPLPKPPPKPPKPRSRLRQKNPLNKVGQGSRRHRTEDRDDSQRIHDLPCISGCRRPATPAHIVGRANKTHRHNPANIFPLCQYCHDWYDHTAEGVTVKRSHRRIIEAGGIVSPEQWLTDAEAMGLREYLRKRVTGYEISI